MSTRASLLASTLEAAINRALAYDPGTRAQLATLEGKVIGLDCTAPELRLYFLIEQGRVRVQSYCEQHCDCTLRGQASEFVKVALTGRSSLANSGVHIEGNPGVMNQLLELLKGLDVDWEDALAQTIGSMPAHTVAEALRANARWAKPRAKALPGYLQGVITEELKLLPAPDEAEAFYNEIDLLRARTARLAARLDLIQQRISP